MSLAVRTTTARWTSPFFTRPRGVASLTETTITSPTPAKRRFDPPSTLMHCTRLAPELSATSRLVCIWIMVQTSCSGRGRRVGADLADHRPALELGDRGAFLDAHRLTLAELIGLVMGMVLLRPLDDLAVDRVRDPALDQHHHRLVGLVGYDPSGQHALGHLV